MLNQLLHDNCEGLSNDLRISCGPSCWPAHNFTFHSALQARCGRAEAGAHSGPSAACAG